MTDDVTYTIRQSSLLNPSTLMGTGSPVNCREEGAYCPATMYLTSGFVSLERAISAAVIKDRLGADVHIDVETQQYPKEAFVNLSSTLSILVSIYMVIAFQPLLQFLITNVVNEKANKFKRASPLFAPFPLPFRVYLLHRQRPC